jgi:hypothetical protein
MLDTTSVVGFTVDKLELYHTVSEATSFAGTASAFVVQSY